MSISYSLGASDVAGWTNLYAHNGEGRVLIAVLKSSSDGTRLDGLTLPGIGPSFVNTQSGDATNLGPNHIQVIP